VSEKLGPDLVTKLLGPYLKQLTEHLQHRGATVDKFIGDAVVAFWGAPNPHPDHALAACTAALDAGSILTDLQTTWADLDIPALRTRIGINTGDALVGNIGFEERLSYTALGDTMNLAARLESLNKLYGTTILVGESTYKATGGKIPGRLIDKVAVKGKTIGTEIYEIYWEKDLPKDWDRFLHLFQEGFSFYIQGNFIKAMDLFTKAHQVIPTDGPTKVLYGRAKRNMDQPPDSLGTWTGVTVLQDK
jgi:adenylate cyclase